VTTAIVITVIGVAVPLWVVVVDTIKALEVRRFAAVARATRIPTFRVAGGTMAAVGALLLEMAPCLRQTF
jgi:hypothetical protein